MKGRVIALSDVPSGAALIVDGRLEDLLLSDPADGPSPGDVCAVRVARKLSTAGAFCTLPGGGQGYLREARDLREGDRMLAQVQSLPEPDKAIPLTTRLLFKGPRLILTPDAPGVNVSRRIGNDAERARLARSVGDALTVRAAENTELTRAGIIVRTEARGEAGERLDRELDLLLAAWKGALRQVADDGAQATKATAGALPDWLFPLPVAILATPSRIDTSCRRPSRGPVRRICGRTTACWRVSRPWRTRSWPQASTTRLPRWRRRRHPLPEGR